MKRGIIVVFNGRYVLIEQQLIFCYKFSYYSQEEIFGILIEKFGIYSNLWL